jgi:hypothetical protein
MRNQRSGYRIESYAMNQPIIRISHVLVWLIMPAAINAQERSPYRAHDSARPRPAVVTPGNSVAAPPSDAIVLFDGTDLAHWQASDGSAAQWVLDDGTMHPTSSSGPLQTKQRFGDVQLHVEWSTPKPTHGKSQGRGNSGVYLMTKYEVQILDSFANETYADGQAAAIYGQNPPMVNVSRAPGQWQSYDIIFRRPRFSDDGSLVKPAILTVYHNGVLVQDHFKLWGPTNWLKFDKYEPHADALPISLQDHGNPVRFRNIWIRNLPDPPSYNALASAPAKIELSDADLDRYQGEYHRDGGVAYEITHHDGSLHLRFWGRDFELVPQSETQFLFKQTEADVQFELDDDGNVNGMTVTITGSATHAKKQ